MADDNRFPSLAQRFHSQSGQGRNPGGTPSPPPRTPGYGIGYQTYSGSFSPASQNLTSKFQQATLNGFNSTGHAQQAQSQQNVVENGEDTSKTEFQRIQEERHNRARELSKQGMHAQSLMQVQSQRSHTISGTMTISEPKPRSSGTTFRKDGPPVEQIITEDAIDDEVGKQMWSSLDLTNVGIRNFSPELFAYSFLTQLHVSNNHITKLSPAIGKLRLLTHLDASNNQITELPAEMAMLTSLRELNLFDNKISTIPAVFGSLYQLEFLGLEGNPLSEPYKTTLLTEGTTALIHSLRDSCPVPMPPPEREWTQIPDGKSDGESFTVFNYNILCERYATAQLYGYTPSWALAWEYRKELILHEITSYGADIICLQEVDKENYDNYFTPQLKEKGYEGVFWAKSRSRTMNDTEQKAVDGCASFFKSSMFELVNKQLVEFNQAPSFKRDPNFKYTKEVYNRLMTKDHIAVIIMLERKGTGSRLMLANAHIEWNPKFRDVKVLQVAMLMDEIQTMASGFAKNPARTVTKDKAPVYQSGTDIPLIVCSDFNSIPQSGVYEFMSRGFIEKDHEDFMQLDYGNYIKDGRKHDFSLKSAYQRLGELPFTNYTPGFQGVIDYIWYTTNSLEVIGLLKEVDQSYTDGVVGFPNAHFPSE